jgi:hypothetical protein
VRTSARSDSWVAMMTLSMGAGLRPYGYSTSCGCHKNRDYIMEEGWGTNVLVLFRYPR